MTNSSFYDLVIIIVIYIDMNFIKYINIKFFKTC